MKPIGRVLVTFDINGKERFLNLIKAKNIRIDEVKIVDDKVTFWMDAKDFFELRSIYKKTKNRPRIIYKDGIYFKLRKVLLKKSIIFGMGIFLSIIFLFTKILWNVKVEDNYIYSKEDIEGVLREEGVYAGIRKKNIDCKEIEDALRIKYNDISWVSARIEGCTLIVQLKENKPRESNKRSFGTKETFNRGLDYNTSQFWTKDEGSLVAPCDGVIESIVTMAGTPMVKKGDVVSKGQVIIDGKVEIIDDFGENISNKNVLASGNVYILGEYYYESKLDINYKSKEYKNNKKIYYVRVGDNKLFLYKPFDISGDCDIIESEYQLGLNNDILKNIYFGSDQYLFYSIAEDEYSDAQAKELLVKELNDKINSLKEEEIFVKNYNLEFSKEEESVKLSGTLQVLVRANHYADIVYDNNEKGEEINVGN